MIAWGKSWGILVGGLIPSAGLLGASRGGKRAETREQISGNFDRLLFSDGLPKVLAQPGGIRGR